MDIRRRSLTRTNWKPRARSWRTISGSARSVAGAVSPPEIAVEPASLTEETGPFQFRERRKFEREIYVARPRPQQDEQLTPADVNLILRVDKLKQQELAEQLMIERLGSRSPVLSTASSCVADASRVFVMRRMCGLPMTRRSA